MSDFYKKFLSEDVRKLGAASGRQIFLAAFGKHPGWDDHVEDLGLDSESLVYVKSRLYVQGIGGQIDSGGWEKLDDSQRLASFKHLLLWQRGNQCIIGRLWSSSDGKGRTRYPLIVCAHCVGLPVEWALAQVLPRLEQIEQACLSTNSAPEVRGLLEQHRSELRSLLASADASFASPVTSSVIGDFVNNSALGPDKEGWYRILHQMHSQMALFAPGKFSLKGDLGSLRPQQVRVPACAPSPLLAFLLWGRFFQTQIDSAVPLLFTLPLEEGWLDLTAGEPTPLEAFSLRASPKSIPLASEVPYNLEPAFREKACAQVAAFAGDTAMKPRGKDVPSPVARQATSGGKLKLLRWLGGGAAVLIVAGLAFGLTLGNRGRSKQLAAAPTSTNSVSESDRAAEAQSRIQQQNAALEAQRLAQADARAKAEAQASAKAEEVRLAMAQAEQRRKVQAEAIAKAEAEAKAKVEAETKAKADEAVRLLAMAAEAEKMKQAEALARTKAEIAARAKADAEQARAIPTVIASVAPASIPEPKSIVGSSPRHITNRVGLELILLAGDLWVGKFEVTQGEYVKVMGKNPSKVMGNPRLPVESVTWEDARRFCEKLGEMEKASGSLPEGFAYNLPTQEQWDLLLGGAAFPDAVTSQQGTRNAPALVGTLSPNNHGLHDVLGNVWEWCLDGPSSQEKALRGGAFNNQRTFRFKPLTPQTVHKLPPHEKSHDVGFRCVMARTQ